MAGRIAREASPQVAGELWTATYVLMGLRYKVEQIETALVGVLDMKESVTFQAILAEGRKEGRKEGREEGREEGKVQEARDLLIRLGRERLGRPTDSNVKRIEGITDRVRLEELLLLLNEAKSWRELLATPPARNSSN
jgi:predicted transposase YdaD